jgi:hypothetical protein
LPKIVLSASINFSGSGSAAEAKPGASSKTAEESSNAGSVSLTWSAGMFTLLTGVTNQN